MLTGLSSPSYCRVDAYSGYPDRELIDTLVGYGFILFGLTLIYRAYDRRALYHNRDLLLACMTLSLLSSIIFFVGVCFDSSVGVRYLYWSGCNSSSTVLQFFLHNLCSFGGFPPDKDAGIEHRSFKDMHVERLSGKDAVVDVDTVDHTEKQ
jgi:hypothetical protein